MITWKIKVKSLPPLAHSPLRYWGLFTFKRERLMSMAQSKAEQLLLAYRLTVWRKSALESVPGTKQDTLADCAEQMRFTEELVETLRDGNPLGEKLYRIIHITYMTKRQPADTNEILSELNKNHKRIPRSTYFRLRGCAIDLLAQRLEEKERLNRGRTQTS
jgi:D-serine deaminase-like pyridoxal phosphate-dependent protein